MERIYLKNLTNLYLIHQKYATLEKAVKDSIGVDKLEQDMFVDKNTVEEMYINLDQVYESLELLGKELNSENKLGDFESDEVDEKDFEANKKDVKQTKNVIDEFNRMKKFLYENRKQRVMNLHHCYLLAYLLELLHELKYSAKRVWCCGKPIVIDRCLENIFTNFYKCLGINIEVVHSGKPVAPKIDMTDLVLGIKINPYWL